MNLRSLLTNHSCNVCGKILLGVAYQDWNGNRVCEEHNKCFCSSCGRYYGAKATEIVSGEWLCENCKNNLPDKAGVEKTVSYIRTFYKQHGLEIQSHVVLKGVTAAQMARLYSSDAMTDVPLTLVRDVYIELQAAGAKCCDPVFELGSKDEAECVHMAANSKGFLKWLFLQKKK